MAETDKMVGVLVASITLVLGVVAEVLLFWNPDCRAEWSMMWLHAIISPFMFIAAGWLALAGVIALFCVPLSIFSYVTDEDTNSLYVSCVVACAGLLGGGGIVYYWVESIVVNECPAFGYNPYNTYAITGPNTIVLLPVLSLAGAISGAILGKVLHLLALLLALPYWWASNCLWSLNDDGGGGGSSSLSPGYDPSSEGRASKETTEAFCQSSEEEMTPEEMTEAFRQTWR